MIKINLLLGKREPQKGGIKKDWIVLILSIVFLLVLLVLVQWRIIKEKENTLAQTFTTKKDIAYYKSLTTEVNKAKEDQKKFGIETAWGKLYPNVIQLKNGIRLEYWQTATQNIFGRGLWSAKDVNQRSWQVAKEKMGLTTSPEHFYKSQFENELTDLANQKILIGWTQNWKITTTIAGRDIDLLLKQEE